ncbi:hypothetical protein AVEN_17303-1 [Araneus ventricosus]|uniref:Uncharacterized protein n=1 Tax=Araneus ventricosus TaxID=182803 RepID=A0A4Y2QH71_ARAVE|nr:hypothetical protein AVEN_17303-1 [Araneus ventricosus]
MSGAAYFQDCDCKKHGRKKVSERRYRKKGKLRLVVPLEGSVQCSATASPYPLTGKKFRRKSRIYPIAEPPAYQQFGGQRLNRTSEIERIDTLLTRSRLNESDHGPMCLKPSLPLFCSVCLHTRFL